MAATGRTWTSASRISARGLSWGLETALVERAVWACTDNSVARHGERRATRDGRSPGPRGGDGTNRDPSAACGRF
eukprot:5851251-Prymnesium_polylepis.1